MSSAVQGSGGRKGSLVLLALLSFATVTCLLTGCFVPFEVDGDGPFNLVAVAADGEGFWGGEGLLMTIGFGGLLVVTAAVAVHCLAILLRGHGARMLWLGRVLFTLLAAGALVPIVLTLRAFSPEAADNPGWGMAWFGLGVVLYGVLVISPVRRMWSKAP